MYPKQSGTRKFLKWAFAILILLSLIFVVYIYTLQPILGIPFVPSKFYKGLEYYSSGDVWGYEKGATFLQELATYHFSQSCEIVDFYHYDNVEMDSFVYGKRPDVYAVRLDSGEQYSTLKQYIEESGKHVGTMLHYGNHKTHFYLMPSHSNVSSDRFVFIVGEGAEILWFILVTEVENSDSDIVNTIATWSSIDFDGFLYETSEQAEDSHPKSPPND